MSLSDSVSDFLTRIRNAQRSSMVEVLVPSFNLCASILSILQKEGYISDFSEVTFPNKKVRRRGFGSKGFSVKLKYYAGSPVINKISRISTPGRRIYFPVKKIPKLYNGLGVFILSTSKGVLSDSSARKAGVGGEILCGVF